MGSVITKEWYHGQRTCIFYSELWLFDLQFITEVPKPFNKSRMQYKNASLKTGNEEAALPKRELFQSLETGRHLFRFLVWCKVTGS